MLRKFSTPEDIRRIKEVCPPNTRILLRFMEDFHAVPPGMTGTVTNVDDVGTIHMHWDNGQTLGLVLGVDKFSIIS